MGLKDKLVSAVTNNFREVEASTVNDKIKDYIMEGEKVIRTFETTVDLIIFTDRRLITIDSTIGSKKKDITSILNTNILNVAVSTAGVGISDANMFITYKAIPLGNELALKQIEFSKKYDKTGFYRELLEIAMKNQNKR